MRLKNFIYVNWGNIPLMEFELGPINLFSGGNGSGKTTAADAIQTVMTAAHDNLFHFNPGQEESTQRGRGKQVRTLASYVLGCDDGSFARTEPTVGYLAAVFYPTEGETAEPFTALIGTAAYLDNAGSVPVARQSDMLYCILPGTTLSKSDFTVELNGQSQIVPLNQIAKHFSGRGVETVERYETKKQYLRRLYAALRGRDDAISEREATNAARAFSRFMSYKPVKSIDGFVAQEILEQKDLGDAIRTVSDLMKTISGLENEANRLKSQVDQLHEAQQSADHYVEHWVELNVAEFTTAKARFLSDQKKYLTTKQEQQTERLALDALQNEIKIQTERRDQTHDVLVGLEAQRRGISALQDKDRLQKQIAQNNEHLHQLSVPLLEQNSFLEATLSASQEIHKLLATSSLSTEISALANKKLMTTAKTIAALDRVNIDFRQLMNQDWIDISPIEASLDEALNQQHQLNEWRDLWFDEASQAGSVAIRDQVQRLVDRRSQKLTQIRQQIQRKQQEVDSLLTQQVTYPYHVRGAVEAIKQSCPEADPRVLCDYVEILEPEWQMALEGYLGGARFGILVAPEHEAEAIKIVRNLPKENRARVIQGSKAKADASRVTLPKNSIVHLMSFDHEIAKAYITASYGLVEQCLDAEQLKQTRRGVTRQGMGSGAYSMYRCDIPQSDLVFGIGARELALAAKKNDVEELAQQANAAQQALQESEHLYQQINQLRQLNHGNLMCDMLETQRKLAKAESALTALDLGDASSIEEEYRSVEVQLKKLDETLRLAAEQKGKIEERISLLTKSCEVLSNKQEDTEIIAEEKETYLRQIIEAWPAANVEDRIERAEREAESVDLETMENQRKSLHSELTGRAHKLEQLLRDHNQQCQPQDGIVFQADYREVHDFSHFKTVVQVSKGIDQIHNRLKNNVLVNKVDQLAQLRESFNSAFVTNLCHAIYQSIHDGKKILEDLNKELEHHRFGADRERYWFDYEWVPEFKEYWHFFEEVYKNPLLGEGKTLFDAQLSERSRLIRDQLMRMLLDNDEQKALRELERISDYRNYRTYEIFKQPEGKAPIALSQYGTGSGGQLETPAYIIRSAAITSAFRFSEGDNHLRMVLVDEAFSKMDEARSKEVIRYLTESLGLQLLFIMPTSKSGPFMDMISNQFVFSKVPLLNGQKRGDLATKVLVDRQQCNSEKIQALWANHRKVIRKQAELDFLEGL